jgi:tetratricopeptide (TPR) repeat protein|tara:strand:- start:3614 stop:4459 length:846 start_codon:yes stop_codon:yes gene_type:complete
MKNKLTLILIFICYLSYSQLQSPVASPKTKIFQKVGLVDINLEYSRPSKNDRKIFGGLVPYGKIWRTGANNPTLISFSDNIKLNNKLIEKGDYHIYSVPSESNLDLIIYEKTDAWGSLSEFDESLIKARVVSNFIDLPITVETFTITFNNISNNGASLIINWDNKQAVYKIDVLTKGKMIKNINKILSENPTANDYRKAAVYYYEENIDISKAVKWIDSAFKDSDNLKYWQLMYKALIYEKAGNIIKAKEYAEKGFKNAKEINTIDGINALEIIVERLNNY